MFQPQSNRPKGDCRGVGKTCSVDPAYFVMTSPNFSEKIKKNLFPNRFGVFKENYKFPLLEKKDNGIEVSEVDNKEDVSASEEVNKEEE